jgi:arylsulfatase A-like enzyme
MKNTRRNFLKSAGAAGTALSLVPSKLFAGSVRRPNIIYLFSDEHRWQSMSFTDMPELKTPTMARMMREGTSFDFAISNNPVCVPHRCMLLSGKWSHRTGAVENEGGLAPGDKTLGHIFGEAGYVTGYTGKWHAGAYAQQAGFDWHMLWNNTNWHWNSTWDDLHGGGGRKNPCKKYQPVKMTDQALEFIHENSGADRPFFLMVAWNPPHAVFTDAPEEKKALYPDSSSLPWRDNAEEAGKQKWWKDYQGYHAHITAIDEQIGRIFQTLEKTGELENTIVIYSADHGSMMNSHGKGNKRHPQDESCRVPFLVTGPGIPKEQIRRELFGTIDIFPTLCGLAGIGIPDFCDGQDFSANIRNCPGICDPESQLLMHVAILKAMKKAGNTPLPEFVRQYSDAPFFRGVRGKRYTCTVNTDGEWQLWDNLNDPLQQKNLIDDPAYADVTRAMHTELEHWLEKAELPFLSEVHKQMPLADRIAQQAVDGAQRIPLHHILMRLKLSPEQFAALPDIQKRFYDEKGFPRERDGRNAWMQAMSETAEKMKKILNTEQCGLLDQMLSKEPLMQKGI